MREITAKYVGECRECGAEVEPGDRVIYERRCGVYCLPCAPTDPEAIREARTEGAERKAARLEEWAAKREAKAERVLTSQPELRRDWAFITQPGHIPERARMNARDDRAVKSLQKARAMRGRAASLRAGVRVKGDAAARRAEIREYVRPRLKVGDTVQTAFYGTGKVLKINRKTARIGHCGSSGTYETLVDLTMITPPRREAIEA